MTTSIVNAPWDFRLDGSLRQLSHHQAQRLGCEIDIAPEHSLGLKHQCTKTGAMMATKKSPAKKTAAKKTAAKKKSTPRKAVAKSASKKSAAKKSPPRKSGGALHDVARSIGSTLGSIAKTTGKAVDAAKDALPGALRGEF